MSISRTDLRRHYRGSQRKEVINVSDMLNVGVLQQLVRDREERLRRTRLQVSDEHSPRRLRRWVGRQLVRTGVWLANDPSMRPVRPVRAR